MYTYTSYRSAFGSLVNSTETAVLNIGSTLINDSGRMICGLANWPFLNQTTSFSTVSGQQGYTLPYNYRKLTDIYSLNGSYRFVLRVVPSREEWDRINQSTTPSSDYLEAAYIQGNTIYVWPKPASNSTNAITMSYEARYVDLTTADYTTGTVSVTNASTTVTGSGTSWTSSMAGRFIKFTPSDTAANNGDGLWYEIASVESGTSLTLVKEYGGATASGSVAYTIGQTSIIPEAYQELPTFRAAYIYFSAIQPETPRANLFKTMFDEGVARMKADCLSLDTSPVIDWGLRRSRPQNPNSYPYSIGS